MTLQRTLTLSILALAAARFAPAEDGLKPRDLTPATWLDAPAHPPVEIVRDGQARAVVYVADPKGREEPDPKSKGKSTPILKRMVDELVEVVRLSSGATLDVVAEPPAADRPAIVIGDCEEARGAGIDPAQLPVEGFVVKTAANRVYLVGSTKEGRGNDGTARAVTDFLERIVGRAVVLAGAVRRAVHPPPRLAQRSAGPLPRSAGLLLPDHVPGLVLAAGPLFR